MVSGKPGSNIYSVPPMIWCLVSNAPKKSTVKIVWNKSSPDATQEKISGLSIHKPIPISTFPRSQKKRKFCAPYCRQYTGAQTVNHTVQATLTQRGTRMASYCKGLECHAQVTIYHSAFTFFPEAVENSIDFRPRTSVAETGASTTCTGSTVKKEQGGFRSPIGIGKNRIGCHFPQSKISLRSTSDIRYVSGLVSSVLVRSRSVRSVFACM